MNLIFNNYDLEGVYEILDGESLKGSQSRMRSRFLEILEKQLIVIEKERGILLKDYAEKDELGNPVFEQREDGGSFYKLAEPHLFKVELAKLMNESFSIEVDTNNKKMISTVKDVFLNVDKEFSGHHARLYNRYCDIFESVEIETEEDLEQ